MLGKHWCHIAANTRRKVGTVNCRISSALASFPLQCIIPQKKVKSAQRATREKSKPTLRPTIVCVSVYLCVFVCVAMLIVSHYKWKHQLNVNVKYVCVPIWMCEVYLHASGKCQQMSCWVGCGWAQWRHDGYIVHMHKVVGGKPPNRGRLADGPVQVWTKMF